MRCDVPVPVGRPILIEGQYIQPMEIIQMTVFVPVEMWEDPETGFIVPRLVHEELERPLPPLAYHEWVTAPLPLENISAPAEAEFEAEAEPETEMAMVLASEVEEPARQRPLTPIVLPPGVHLPSWLLQEL